MRLLGREAVMRTEITSVVSSFPPVFARTHGGRW